MWAYTVPHHTAEAAKSGSIDAPDDHSHDLPVLIRCMVKPQTATSAAAMSVEGPQPLPALFAPIAFARQHVPSVRRTMYAFWLVSRLTRKA